MLPIGRGPWICGSCGRFTVEAVSILSAADDPGAPGHMDPMQELWCFHCVARRIGAVLVREAD